MNRFGNEEKKARKGSSFGSWGLWLGVGRFLKGLRGLKKKYECFKVIFDVFVFC